MSTVPYAGGIQPPTTDVVSQLSAAPIGVRIKKVVATAASGAFLGALLWGVGWVFDLGWLQYVAYGLGGLLALMGVLLGFTSKVGLCPYCNGQLGNTALDHLSGSDENEQIECGHCYEWLISDQGSVRAFSAADASLRETFQAPVFKEGAWPNECIVCGAAQTRVEEANKSKVELSQLLIGSLSVASAGIKNIPYCDAHSGAVSITVEDDYPRLILQDFDARRRYVFVNNGRVPAKVK